MSLPTFIQKKQFYDYDALARDYELYQQLYLLNEALAVQLPLIDHYNPSVVSVASTAGGTLIMASNIKRAGTTFLSNTGANDAFVFFPATVAGSAPIYAGAVFGQGLPLKAGGSIGFTGSEWQGNVVAITNTGLSTTVAISEGVTA